MVQELITADAVVNYLCIFLGCLVFLLGCQISKEKESSPFGSQVEIERLEKEHPKNPFYPYLLGDLALKEKKLEQARRFFQKALQLDPNYLKAKIGLGFVALEKKEYNKAEAFFNEVLDQDPTNRQANNGLHRLYAEKSQKGILHSS